MGNIKEAQVVFNGVSVFYKVGDLLQCPSRRPQRISSINYTSNGFFSIYNEEGEYLRVIKPSEFMLM